MPSPQLQPDALLAGLACSMRSMSGPAALALRGRITGPAQKALLVAAPGEVVVDKTSLAIDRIAPPSLAGRIGTGAFTGYLIGGVSAALTAGAAAGAGTYATFWLRKTLVAKTGRPDWQIAVGEDLLAYTLAVLATRAVSEVGRTGQA